VTEQGPVPHWEGASVVVEPPDTRTGSWAGAPSAVLVDGVFWLAYRLRLPIGHGRGYVNVIARSTDGVNFEPVAEVRREEFDSESLERPALLRAPDGRWRLYVSVATTGTKHWRVVLLEADTPEKLPLASPRTVLPGDETIAVKDPVVLHAQGRWHLWASVHPLETDEHADRMTTEYATSADGVEWTWQGTALAGRPGAWDERGVRFSSVVLNGEDALALYDGRATAEENWEEVTGVAHGRLNSDGLFTPFTASELPPTRSPFAPWGLRYVSVVPLPGGATRVYYEGTRADGAHELRTELLP
jgi:sucrose-6-phosphate hydrolase SacC (GH32 family)